MTDFQFQMAYIDWDKYGGCFRNLREHPQNLLSCVYTMRGDFQQKDLLKGLTENAPWDSIRAIQDLGARAIQASHQGRSLDPQTEEALRRHCLRFGDWASGYFASTTPPWKRHTPSSGGGRSSGCGCGSVLVVLTFVALLCSACLLYLEQVSEQHGAINCA